MSNKWHIRTMNQVAADSLDLHIALAFPYPSLTSCQLPLQLPQQFLFSISLPLVNLYVESKHVHQV